MIKIPLYSEFINRFQNFLSSDCFNNQPKDAKSSYWDYHSKKINYKMKNSAIFVEGASGNYIPETKYFLKIFFIDFLIMIKKIINFNKPKQMSYNDAFNKIMSRNEISGFQQIKFDKNKIIAKNISQCKKIFSFKYVLNDHYIRSYYYINILNSYIELSKSKFIVEIGAGNGNLLSLLKYHFSPKCLIDIDLPETLILSISFLKNLFPKAKILLPNEINQKINKDTLLNYDFIFLTPNQISLVDENLINLFINICSFQEMNMSQIRKYLNLIQKVGMNGSFFFNYNRVEKTPFAGKKDENYSHIKPNRFFEYPFFDNKVLFFEICKLASLVQNDPLYIRLEKIIK